MQGKIEKWFNDKNFGFINIGEARGLFFHRNELAEGYNPKEGDTVEFEKTQTDKGPAAIKVKKIETTEETTTEVKEEPKTEEKSGLEEVATEVKPDEAEKETTEEVKEEIKEESTTE